MNCQNLTEVMNACPNNTFCDCYNSIGGIMSNPPISFPVLVLIIGGLGFILTLILIGFPNFGRKSRL